MKSWAFLAECVVGGPGIWVGLSNPGAPFPSEPILVTATPYPRQIEVAVPFQRVGMPTESIPLSAIGFEPPTLPANATQFSVVLKDDNYVGANYHGTVKLSAQAPNPASDQQQVVTVGL
jgi:hypothetical protein